jgi:hypothetical protein
VSMTAFMIHSFLVLSPDSSAFASEFFAARSPTRPCKPIGLASQLQLGAFVWP